MKHLILPTWHWSKRLTMVVIIIPVLIFLGFVGAVSLIDFNQYKPQLEQEVSQRTGHEFKIAGAIEVSVFPFAFSASDVALKNSPAIAERFQRENLLSVKQVRAELSVWSLLVDKQLAIKGLELIEPQLTLLQDEQGYNWQKLAKLAGLNKPLKQALKQSLMDDWQRHSAVATAQDLANFKDALRFVDSSQTSPPQSDAQPPETISNSTVWHFDSVIIKQGAFEHQDRRVGHMGEITELNLLAFDVTLGQPFQVRSDFLYSNTLNQRRYQFDVSANVDVSEDFSSLHVTNWQGIFNLTLPEEEKVPPMRLVTEGQRFMLDFLNEQVAFDGLTLTALGSSFTSSFKGRFGINPELSGRMQANNVDARKWFYHLGLPLPGFVNDQALTSMGGTMNWQLAEHKWSFNEIEAQLDNTRLTGNIWQESKAQAAIQSATQTPTYLFDLTVDKLNLNDYLARTDDEFFTLLKAFSEPEDAAEKVDQKEDKKVSRPADNQQKNGTYLPLAVPVSLLRSLQAEGQVQIGGITLDEMALENVQINLTAQQGKIQLAPFDAHLFKGRLASKFELNVNGDTPAYRWYGQLEKVALGAFLNAGWQTKPLDGILNAHFNLSTLGSNPQRLIQNLQGELNLKSAAGEFYGVNLQKLLTGQNSKAGDKTPYQNLVITGKLDKGVVKAKTFAVESDGLFGRGFGSLDLNKATMLSQLKVRIAQPPASLSHLKGLMVPVSYGGPLDNLTWSVDLQSLLKDPGNQEALVNKLKALIAP